MVTHCLKIKKRRLNLLWGLKLCAKQSIKTLVKRKPSLSFRSETSSTCKYGPNSHKLSRGYKVSKSFWQLLTCVWCNSNILDHALQIPNHREDLSSNSLTKARLLNTHIPQNGLCTNPPDNTVVLFPIKIIVKAIGVLQEISRHLVGIPFLGLDIKYTRKRGGKGSSQNVKPPLFFHVHKSYDKNLSTWNVLSHVIADWGNWWQALKYRVKKDVMEIVTGLAYCDLHPSFFFPLVVYWIQADLNESLPSVVLNDSKLCIHHQRAVKDKFK